MRHPLRGELASDRTARTCGMSLARKEKVWWSLCRLMDCAEDAQNPAVWSYKNNNSHKNLHNRLTAESFLCDGTYRVSVYRFCWTAVMDDSISRWI